MLPTLSDYSWRSARKDWQTWFVRHEQWLFPIGVALAARVLLSAFGVYIVATSPIPIGPRMANQYQDVAFLAPTGLNLLSAPFQRWDAVWYERIATRGYAVNDASAAFFPLFPLLTRLVTLGSDATVLAGLLIATLCSTAAFVLFYRQSRSMYDSQTARLATLAWAAFPTAFFLFVPYAEALFVLCALVALDAARQKRWLVAGISGGLAALTRSPGVWLIVPLGVEWLWHARTMDWTTRVKTASALLLVPLGLGLYMLYTALTFGDAGLWLHALAGWENTFSPPWETIGLTIREILFGDSSALANNLIDLTTTLFVLGLGLWGLLTKDAHGTRRLPLMYGMYALVFILMPLGMIAHASGFEALPMASAARRAVVIFPAFMMAGIFLRGRFRIIAYFFVALTAQLVLVYVFVNWLWLD